MIEPWIDEVRRRLLAPSAPFATYRLQFTAAQFRFPDATDLVEYLAELGISHVYASPLLQSRRGSTHGYDVVDYERLNEELGTEQEFEQLVETLGQHGLGLIVDIVPNHMSVGGDENAWWMDVLTHGPASAHARTFDINWSPVQSELRDKILLPMLGDFYGRMLDAGELQLRRVDGAFHVSCYGSLLPLDPRTTAEILERALSQLAESRDKDDPALLEFQSILTALHNLPRRTETSPERAAERWRESIVIRRRLAQLLNDVPAIAAQMDRTLEQFNGRAADPSSFDDLDRLLEQQVYRLSLWKAGSDEMNYRRFFDVTELAAVCMERFDVFASAHRKIFELLVRGQIQGLRVDHVDGLFDPRQYLWRLQWQFVRAMGREEFTKRFRNNDAEAEWQAVEPTYLEAMSSLLGGPPAPGLLDVHGPETAAEQAASPPARPQPLYVVVEKILGADEPLPGDWPIAGTTGYDSLHLINGLFIDPRGTAELERYYARYVERRDDPGDTMYQCKRLVLEGAMHSELQLLAHRLNRLTGRDRRTRDLTLHALSDALREIIASFPVYRTYLAAGSISPRDRRVVVSAVAQARRRNPSIDASAFQFVQAVLLGEAPHDLDDEGEQERDAFIGRFQQVTSPVMAKGVEDTAFFRHIPLLSANEVGCDMHQAAVTVADFHRQNLQRANDWPQGLVTTSTHDTKLSADVRARVHVLSEAPALWRSALQRWTRWNRKYRRDVDGLPAPSRNDEWRFYQTLVGFWPLSAPSEEERRTLIERLQSAMEKAAREAKQRTSWVNPNTDYDIALRDFVAQVLADPQGRFLKDLEQFLGQIADSGLYTALSQALLQLTIPGAGDLYQGQELWNFRLVDPDNRRPVDFARRKWLLGELKSQVATPAERRRIAAQLAREPQDDRLKLLVVWTALQFRRSWPRLLQEAEYVPLEISGARAEHLCAFAWRMKAGSVESNPGAFRAAVVIVPRGLFRLTHNEETSLPCGKNVWKDTAIDFSGLPGGVWTEWMTGRNLQQVAGLVPVASVLTEFPVALLVSSIERTSSP